MIKCLRLCTLGRLSFVSGIHCNVRVAVFITYSKKIAAIKKKKKWCIFYLSPQVGKLRRSTKVREASDINNAFSSSISSATKVHLSFAA